MSERGVSDGEKNNNNIVDGDRVRCILNAVSSSGGAAIMVYYSLRPLKKNFRVNTAVPQIVSEKLLVAWTDWLKTSKCFKNLGCLPNVPEVDNPMTSAHQNLPLCSLYRLQPCW